MKLSDIMSASGLSIYPRIALVLFLLAFLIVVVRLLLPGRRAYWERAAALPLDDVNDRFAGDDAGRGGEGSRRSRRAGGHPSTSSTGYVAGSINGQRPNAD